LDLLCQMPNPNKKEQKIPSRLFHIGPQTNMPLCLGKEPHQTSTCLLRSVSRKTHRNAERGGKWQCSFHVTWVRVVTVLIYFHGILWSPGLSSSWFRIQNRLAKGHLAPLFWTFRAISKSPSSNHMLSI
jgi:hypothetical protein